MSRFTVLVVASDNEQLEERLAPYDERNESQYTFNPFSEERLVSLRKTYEKHIEEGEFTDTFEEFVKGRWRIMSPIRGKMCRKIESIAASHGMYMAIR